MLNSCIAHTLDRIKNHTESCLACVDKQNLDTTSHCTTLALQLIWTCKFDRTHSDSETTGHGRPWRGLIISADIVRRVGYLLEDRG